MVINYSTIWKMDTLFVPLICYVFCEVEREIDDLKI